MKVKWAFSRREDDPRTLIESGEPILTSGVHDALSARLIEKAGFKAAVMGGYATSACLLGKPDVGLLTMTEMSTQLRYICSATGIPVIADGDTGHGNAINVIRTVQEFEAAGAAGILLEDQVAPKKCGYMEGKQVIPKEEHVRKIQAACEARRDPDFIIIARTDARSVNGPDDAIDRALAYKDAGADVLFVEAPIDVAELEEIARSIKAPLVADIIEGGQDPSTRRYRAQSDGLPDHLLQPRQPLHDHEGSDGLLRLRRAPRDLERLHRAGGQLRGV